MALSEMLLPELDQEMASTRRTLERVPDDRLDWTPHEKSMTFRALASHLANIPTWATHAINRDSLDLAPVGGEPVRTPPAGSTAEALEMFDANLEAARAALAGASDKHLLKSWTLLSGGKPLLTMPRVALIRGFVLNHNIHHRAQLGVYLRLNNIPVPSIYGPSADEGGM